MRIAVLTLLVALVSGAAASGMPPMRGIDADRHVRTRARQQDERIQALALRGRDGHYRQLVGGAIPREGFGFRALAPGSDAQAIRDQARFEEIAKREAAIGLAALGYTAPVVAEYRRHGFDLFGMAHRAFSAAATPEEQIVLADTVVVATAVEDRAPSTARADGYLSSLRFEVERTLKGTPVAGDLVHVPQRSGTNPDGSVLRVTSDMRTVPGRRYLLVLSRNAYAQRVAEARRQPEAGFNAYGLLAYEMSDDGALQPLPRASLVGGPPSLERVQRVVARLKALPQPDAP